MSNMYFIKQNILVEFFPALNDENKRETNLIKNRIIIGGVSII